MIRIKVFSLDFPCSIIFPTLSWVPFINGHAAPTCSAIKLIIISMAVLRIISSILAWTWFCIAMTLLGKVLWVCQHWDQWLITSLNEKLVCRNLTISKNFHQKAPQSFMFHAALRRSYRHEHRLSVCFFSGHRLHEICTSRRYTIMLTSQYSPTVFLPDARKNL